MIGRKACVVATVPSTLKWSSSDQSSRDKTSNRPAWVRSVEDDHETRQCRMVRISASKGELGNLGKPGERFHCSLSSQGLPFLASPVSKVIVVRSRLQLTSDVNFNLYPLVTHYEPPTPRSSK